MTFDVVVRTLRHLARHDVAADVREGINHCLELQAALDLLRGIDGGGRTSGWRYDHAAGTVRDGNGQVICYVAGRHHEDPSVGERIAASGEPPPPASTVADRIERIARVVTERADLPPEIKADVLRLVGDLVDKLHEIDAVDAEDDPVEEAERHLKSMGIAT